ncbi:MAG: NAD-dependent epimerase/dehydratase family protein [Phycisphaerae bacterium]
MRVLVTGHRGYLGTILFSVLKHARCDVVGLDCDWYKGCDFGRVHQHTPGLDMDVREVDCGDLVGLDAVVHLAALPERACSDFPPRLVDEVNVEATIRLAELCKQASVSRFVFASTCAVYGRGEYGLLDENGPLDPATTFAQSKLRCERELTRRADRRFCPVILRNPTLYGVSPRLRTDTVVNDLVAAAVSTGKIAMQSSGGAWRPLAHAEDVAHAYAALLAAPDRLVHRQTFNVVRSDENYRVIDIADAITELVPQSARSITPNVFDQRSYRVDGSKLQRLFPSLRFKWTLPFGIRQLRSAMLVGGLTPGDWRSDRYRRSLRLKTLLERKALGSDLRARQATPI